MTTPTIQGGRVGSRAALQRLLARSSGNFIRSIPKEGITVRFLTELDDWVSYKEISGPNTFPRPLLEGEVAPKELRTSNRFLAAALDIEEDRVICLRLPVSAVKRLDARFERFGTVCDRDYELSRFGEGIQTEYEVQGLKPMQRNLAKYEVPDLLAVLVEAATEDREPGPVTTPSARRAAGVRKATAQVEADFELPADDPGDDDDDDYADDDEDDEPAPPSDVDAEISLTMHGAAGDGGDEASMDYLTERAEAAGIDPDRYRTWAELAQAIEGFPPKADADGEAVSEFYTEAELKAMPINELRVLAKQNGVSVAGASKPALVTALLGVE
jgi:hypothetical protein